MTDHTSHFLISHAKELWQSHDTNTLWIKFAAFLKTTYGITQFSAFHGKLKGKHQSIIRESIPIPSPCSLSDDEIESLMPLILSQSLGPQKTNGTFQSLSLGEETYELVIVGRDESQFQMGIWTKADKPCDLQDWWVQLFIHEFSVLQKIDQTQAMLYIDDLTGLYNYRYLESSLTNEIRRASRFAKPFSILFIDLDQFKAINDQKGHLIGSQVLKQFAQTLKQALREIDTIFRYGGDEFVVILLETTCVEAQLVAERIRKQVAQTPFGSPKHPVFVTTSIGISSFPQHGKSATKLLKQADEGMYTSKRLGRNRVSW